MKMNNLLRDKDIDNLKEVVVFANTPSYLYKNFRRNPAVIGLAEKYRTEELIEFFERLVQSEKLNMETLTKTYALLFAISLKDYAESRRFLNGVDRYKNLEWIKEIQEIIIDNARATTIKHIDLNHKTSAVPMPRKVELRIIQDAR